MKDKQTQSTKGESNQTEPHKEDKLTETGVEQPDSVKQETHTAQANLPPSQEELNAAFHITSGHDRLLFEVNNLISFLESNDASSVPRPIESIVPIAEKYLKDFEYAINVTTNKDLKQDFQNGLDKARSFRDNLVTYETILSHYGGGAQEHKNILESAYKMRDSLDINIDRINETLASTPNSYN